MLKDVYCGLLCRIAPVAYAAGIAVLFLSVILFIFT